MKETMLNVFPKDHTIVMLPGFCDVHVHFREPGFSYKETILTGSKAAARGGYTTVCTMPNLNPVPDSRENLDIQLKAIKEAGHINVIPYGSITVKEAGEELQHHSYHPRCSSPGIPYGGGGRSDPQESL